MYTEVSLLPGVGTEDIGKAQYIWLMLNTKATKLLFYVNMDGWTLVRSPIQITTPKPNHHQISRACHQGEQTYNIAAVHIKLSSSEVLTTFGEQPLTSTFFLNC